MFAGGVPGCSIGLSTAVAGIARSDVPATRRAGVVDGTGGGLCPVNTTVGPNREDQDDHDAGDDDAGRMPRATAGRWEGLGASLRGAGPGCLGDDVVHKGQPTAGPDRPAGDRSHRSQPKWSIGPWPAPSDHARAPVIARAT